MRLNMTAPRSISVILTATGLLVACNDKPSATAPDEPAQVEVAAIEPAPAAQIETRTATVLGRALAANGLAEAQVVEATRAGGVLTVSVRFQRAQGASSVKTLFGAYQLKDQVYLVASAKKYFLLTDAEGVPLALPGVQLSLGPNTPVAGLWYGKFPAPPPEVKRVSLVLPDVGPLDAIPLTDR